MQNSTYVPQNISEFKTGALAFAAKGVFGVIPAGAEASIDLVLTDDVLLLGGRLHLENSKFGDKVWLRVLLPDLTVAAEYVSGWYVGGIHQEVAVASPYPSKIPAGMVLRVTYQSTGASPVSLAVNYDLHNALF